MTAPLLQATGLIGGYGGMDILQGVDLTVEAHEVAVIIGPNGAGKSTAMKALIGLIPLKSGKVLYAGEDITGQAPERLVARGIAYVPQERNVFRTMTVEENLAMGAYLSRGDLGETLARIYALFPALKDKRRQRPGAHDRAEAAPAGRAYRRPLAQSDRRDLRAHPGDQRRRRRHTDGGAECPRGAGNRPSRLCARHRPQPLHRQRRRPPRQSRGGGVVPGRVSVTTPRPPVLLSVMPAKAGIQDKRRSLWPSIPAFAGMTDRGDAAGPGQQAAAR